MLMRMGKLTFVLPFLLFSCTKNSSETPTIAALQACTADGQINCLTTEAFPATIKTAIMEKAGQFRNTLSLGGVTGTLVACASDNGIHCFATAEYPSVIKSLVTPNVVKNGKQIAGVTGTFAPPCAADGQIDCITTVEFTGGNSTLLTAFDLRVGKTIGGIAARMIFNKNATDTTTFNRTAGSGAAASASTPDAYDTLDDYNNNGAFPTAKVSGWPALSGNFLRDAASDTDANGSCNGAEECVLADLNTHLSFAKTPNTVSYWENAITACESLVYGSYSDWRLPTQKELIQAYIDGLYAQKLVLSADNYAYQSATTLGLDQTKIFTINLATGEVSDTVKIVGGMAPPPPTARYICVR